MIVQLVKNRLQCRRPQFDFWVGKIHWRRDRLPSPVFLASLVAQLVKNSACNAGGPGLIPGLGRSPGEGKGYPVQYSGLKNSMDCTGVAKSQTWLSDFHFHFQLAMYNGIYSSPKSRKVIHLKGSVDSKARVGVPHWNQGKQCIQNFLRMNYISEEAARKEQVQA